MLSLIHARGQPQSVAEMAAMSAGPSTGRPITTSRTPRHAPCDIGATKAAIETSGEASHSPQPVTPSATTLTTRASWLPSPASVTTGMER